MFILHFIILIRLSIISVQSAKILAWFPTPSVSHQVVFRPVTQELAKRGHEVVVITTDPAFPPGQAPPNLTEIDLHDKSYSLWRELIMSNMLQIGDTTDHISMMKLFIPMITKIYEMQIQSEQVQNIIKNEKDSFDLLIMETTGRPLLPVTQILKVPVIFFSSLSVVNDFFDVMGAPARPVILYPTMMRQKLNNLSLMDKLSEIYNHYKLTYVFDEDIETDIKIIKRVFGPDASVDFRAMMGTADLLFLNVNPLWDQNRPVPPGVVYLGGLHQNPEKDLPKEWKTYLDSSKNGVIYISFGTNVSPSHLPPERIQLLVKVFSQLPYDILWKWDKDELPGRTANIKIAKWLPQSDLLRHPKVKVFITQCGLQSTDEAITAGVPLIGMPMLGDQWYNAEMYEKHEIGIRADLSGLTEESLKAVIDKIVNDDSYRQNIIRLRNIMQDQPQTPLERAVWWTEYVIRHGGAKHLRAPAANMSWAEYLDLELLAAIAGIVFTLISLVVLAIYLVFRFIRNTFFSENKLKIS